MFLTITAVFFHFKKNHPSPWKSFYVDKIDLNMTKNPVFGYGILITFRNLHFSIGNKENKEKKNKIPGTKLKTTSVDVLNM